MTQYITVAADDRVEAKNGVIKLHGPEGVRRHAHAPAGSPPKSSTRWCRTSCPA